MYFNTVAYEFSHIYQQFDLKVKRQSKIYFKARH